MTGVTPAIHIFSFRDKTQDEWKWDFGEKSFDLRSVEY